MAGMDAYVPKIGDIVDYSESVGFTFRETGLWPGDHGWAVRLTHPWAFWSPPFEIVAVDELASEVVAVPLVPAGA